MTDWLPLRNTLAISAYTSSIESPSTCALCDQKFSLDQVIQLSGILVCGSCKPKALQQMREGLPVGSSTSVMREGKSVIAPDGVCFPDRCVKCNGTVNTPALKRKLAWHPSWVYILIPVGILIYAIGALLTRKKAVVYVYLCDMHKKKRSFFMILGWSGFLLGFGTMLFGLGAKLSWLIGFSFIFMLGAAITGIIGSNIVRAKRIKDQTVWLKGCSKEFLQSLPGRN